MNRYAPAHCYNCGHQWQIDRQQEERTVYRQEQQNTAREEYLVTCRNCGKQVVVVVTVRLEE